MPMGDPGTGPHKTVGTTVHTTQFVIRRANQCSVIGFRKCAELALKLHTYLEKKLWRKREKLDFRVEDTCTVLPDPVIGKKIEIKEFF